MGWLHATPKSKDKNAEPVARVKTLEKGSIYLEMPDLDSYQYLIKRWFEFGLSKVGGMQVVPMDWQDVAAYNRRNELDYWEELQLIKLSKAYVTSLNSSKESNSKAPYCSNPELAIQQDRDKVARQLMEMKAARRSRR